MWGNPVFTALFFNTSAEGFAIVNYVWASCALNALAMIFITITFFVNIERVKWHDALRNQSEGKKTDDPATTLDKSEASAAAAIESRQQPLFNSGEFLNAPAGWSLMHASVPVGAVLCDMLLFLPTQLGLAKRRAEAPTHNAAPS